MFVSSEHPRNQLFCPLSGAAAHSTRGSMSGLNSNNSNNNAPTNYTDHSSSTSGNHGTPIARTAWPPERELITTTSKRGRDSYPARDCEQALPQPVVVVPLDPLVETTMTATTASSVVVVAPSTKKIRTNNYRPPLKVPPSFTSQVGSFAVSQVSMGNNKRELTGGRAVVGLRRQLSSSKIEAFLSSGDDAMDVDAEQSRPRSMSL